MTPVPGRIGRHALSLIAVIESEGVGVRLEAPRRREVGVVPRGLRDADFVEATDERAGVSGQLAVNVSRATDGESADGSFRLDGRIDG